MRLLLVAGWIFVGGVAAAAGPPVKVASIEGVTEYRLANGARVLLFPEASRPTVTVNMTVLVGSRHEGYGESGMAHLLEHLVFKGTPTHPEVPKALRDHGASFNGTTNSDRTNYFETMPATDENLEFGIAIECDRLVNSFVKREDLVSEMTVVRNEFERGENNPSSILNQRIYAAAYEWHNYGKSTIGNRTDIERVPIDNLQAFYKKYYQPDNVVLIVAGKFEEAKALALVEKHLGSIPKPTRTLDATYTEEPPQDGERTVTLRRVGAVGSVGVAYHVPAAAHPDWAPLSLLGGLVSQSPNGRLYKALVESKLATGAFAGSDNSHDAGLFFASASCPPESLDAVRDGLVSTLESLGDVAFTDDEVNKAKVRSKRSAEMLQSNSQAMATTLSSASSRGDWRLLFVQRDRVADVTAADVNRVARAYFQKPNRTVGVYIPAKEAQRLTVPTAPAIATVVNDYKGGTVGAAGEAFDPSPTNLDARLRVVTEGGLKAGLLAKKNRGETVSLVLTLHYGNEESLKGQTTAAGMLPGLMMAGTKKHDRQALREQLDALGIRIGVGAGGGGGRGGRGAGGGGGGGTVGQLTFSVEARRDTLPQALKLLGEILREPAFPAAEFETSKRRMSSMMAAGSTEPRTLAGNKLSRTLSPYSLEDVRYVPTLEETLDRVETVTLEQVRTLYETQVGGSHAELGVVGDFDPETTLRLVKGMLADWESKVPVKRLDHKVAPNVTGYKEDIVTPDKSNAEYLAGLSFPLSDGDPDYAALRIGNFIFGGSTLASRLGDRIRQKDGLSYGATSSFTASSRDPVASLTVTVSTNPANIDKVTAAVMEELQRFLKDGPTEVELTDAKRAFLEAQKVGRTGDGAIAGQIVSNLNIGRTFAHIAELEKAIQALTPAKVAGAFRKHVDPSRLVVIRAGDFKK
ncbi:M16 family metallopeptidase [Fimbriiglobus ruber]|uniref:Peptidase M16 n=1 Tax=Fimbriiglobus ruber TaxID=1908690 RepID=A0A225DCH2_9BACT|nr:pitrilysin family protein [Fimbriiglobus ruber]OWK35006.1 peptidase M16 [Fimbriiglobus ruber]